MVASRRACAAPPIWSGVSSSLEPLFPCHSPIAVVRSQVQTTIVVGKEADSWDKKRECCPASCLLPDGSQLTDGQDLRATEVRGALGRSRLGQIAKPERELGGVDRLESHVRVTGKTAAPRTLSRSWWNWVARAIAQVVRAAATICSAASFAR